MVLTHSRLDRKQAANWGRWRVLRRPSDARVARTAWHPEPVTGPGGMSGGRGGQRSLLVIVAILSVGVTAATPGSYAATGRPAATDGYIASRSSGPVKLLCCEVARGESRHE